MTTLLYAVFGLIVGMIINLLADDLPYLTGMFSTKWTLQTIISALPYHRKLERWRCVVCQLPRWPLATLAYLTGRGKCARCGTPISWRAVIIELFTALVFAFLWQRYAPSFQLILVSFYLSVYILVTVTDFEHRLILNAVTYPAIIVAMVSSPFNADFGLKGAWLGGLLAFGVLLLIYGLGALFGRVRGKPGVVPFGQGDVKLGAFIGLTTGPTVVFALMIGIASAGVVALGYVIYLLVIHRRSALGVAMPYGPFLALGGALMVVFPIKIL